MAVRRYNESDVRPYLASASPYASGVQPDGKTIAARRFNALARVAFERESARTREG